MIIHPDFTLTALILEPAASKDQKARIVQLNRYALQGLKEDFNTCYVLLTQKKEARSSDPRLVELFIIAAHEAPCKSTMRSFLIKMTKQRQLYQLMQAESLISKPTKFQSFTNQLLCKPEI